MPQTVLLCQGDGGLDSLQSLSDGVIANELDSIHGHQDAAHGSSQATASDKGVLEGAKEQTASALQYAQDQLKQKSDQVLQVQPLMGAIHMVLRPHASLEHLSTLTALCRRTLRSQTSRMLWLTLLRMPRSQCSPLTPSQLCSLLTPSQLAQRRQSLSRFVVFTHCVLACSTQAQPAGSS